MRTLRLNYGPWSARLRELAAVDELGAYVWLAFTCGLGEARNQSLDELVAPAATFKDTPLSTFKRAVCRGVEPDPLRALLERDPRFREVPYFLGRFTLGAQNLDEADTQFEKAYRWRQQWPTLTQMIANVAMTSEEFDRALIFYEARAAHRQDPPPDPPPDDDVFVRHRGGVLQPVAQGRSPAVRREGRLGRAVRRAGPGPALTAREVTRK